MGSKQGQKDGEGKCNGRVESSDERRARQGDTKAFMSAIGPGHSQKLKLSSHVRYFSIPHTADKILSIVELLSVTPLTIKTKRFLAVSPFMCEI